MLIGYARVSTTSQNLEMQLLELKQAGCEMIFSETASGAKSERPEFLKMKDVLREGDTVVVWKIDRLGRTLAGLVQLIQEFDNRGIGLKSLHDPIDTTSSQGRFVFNIFASLADFEREIIRERTIAGLQAARAHGRFGGRRKGLSKKSREKAEMAKALYKSGELPVSKIAANLEISRTTFYKYLKYDLIGT